MLAHTPQMGHQTDENEPMPGVQKFLRDIDSPLVGYNICNINTRFPIISLQTSKNQASDNYFSFGNETDLFNGFIVQNISDFFQKVLRFKRFPDESARACIFITINLTLPR